MDIFSFADNVLDVVESLRLVLAHDQVALF
jgi:hypothetical protein